MELMKARSNWADAFFMAAMITTLALPVPPIVRGLSVLAFLAFMLYASGPRLRNPLQAIWLAGFAGLCYASKSWAAVPSAVDELIKNVVWSVMLSYSTALYVCVYRLDVARIAKRMSVIALFLAASVALFGISSDGDRLSTGGNANQFGAIVVGVCCFLIYFAKKEAWRNWFVDVLIVLLTVCALMSGSRGGLAVLGIYAIMFLWFEYPPKNPLKIVGVVVGILLLAGLALFCVMKIDFLYNSIGVRLESLFDYWMGRATSEASAASRSNMKLLAADMFSQRPWLGFGMNNFKHATYYGTYSHSNFYELASCLGLVGLATYYLPLLIFFKRSLALWKNAVADSIVPAAIFLASLLRDFNSMSYFSTPAHIFLGFAIGLTYCMTQARNEQLYAAPELTNRATR